MDITYQNNLQQTASTYGIRQAHTLLATDKHELFLLLATDPHRHTRTGCEMLGAFPSRDFPLGQIVRTKTASLREDFVAQRAHGFSPAKACRSGA